MTPSLVMYEEEFDRISQLLNRLRIDASAKIVFPVSYTHLTLPTMQ